MSSASSLLAEIDCSFVVALWLRTMSCWHDSPEEYREGNQNRSTLCLDFHLRKCNWVDTGQECTLSEFSLSDICAYKTFDVLYFSLGGVTWLAPIMRPQTSGGGQLNSSQFPFDPGAKCVTVSIRLTATDLSVWNSRISFTFMARTGYTVNVEALQLQGCSGRCCLFAYSNSMTRVWDPGQSWCANSSILQSDSALAVALSSNYIHFYIVERSLSFYLKTLTSKVTGLTWRRNVLVFLLAWHAENKAQYMDMRILETCLLKVNGFASLGTLLLWKDNFGLAPVAKYLCSFWSASITLILAYFHRCKSEGLDTAKPLVYRSAFLVLTRLVFSVGLGEQNCATYFIQAVVVLTIGVGIFDIGADNDLPTRNSTDAKIIVPLIVVWTAGTCSLFIPWYTTLLLVHEEISSANLVFTTTLRICHMVNLHNTFMVLHSLRSWTKQLTMISTQRYRLKNKTEHMWLPLSNGIVITVPFNGIDGKK